MPNYYNNFSYVIDASFQPFSMQEMLVPLQMYKDEYDKTEAAYTDLSEKSDKFKYLSETLPEGSKARQLYEGYANELSKQAEDLAKHGLSMNNRRSLTNLKRRYQGEIGRLIDADTAMQEERKLRRQMNAKDSSMLYADENLSIDSFLDGNTPNLYNISGTELYTRGAAAGKSASSRIYNAGDEGSTLNGYYRKWVERNGYSKESMDAFRANASAIPELQQAADAILAERGALDNLSGINLERARQSVLNGIIDGAVYAESVKPVRDEGVMSASAREQYALQREQMQKNAAMAGLTWNTKTNSWDYDSRKDPKVAQAASIAEARAKNNSASGKSGTAYDVRNKEMTMIGAKTGSKYKHQDDDKAIGRPLEDAGGMRALTSKEYSQLVDAHGNITNEYVRNAIGNGRLSDYEIYIIPASSTKIDDSGFIWDDSTDEDIYVVKPRESKRSATNNEESSYIGSGDNDIPE